MADYIGFMNFIASLIITFLVVITFILGVRYTSTESFNKSPIVHFDERGVADFVTNIMPAPAQGPYVVQARIIGEASYVLELDFAYLVPAGDSLQYFMNVGVGGGQDIPLQKVYLDPKNQTVRVRLHFKPSSVFMARFSTTYIYVEINTFVPERRSLNVYRRRISYPKQWIKKHEDIRGTLNPSTFFTKTF